MAEQAGQPDTSVGVQPPAAISSPRLNFEQDENDKTTEKPGGNEQERPSMPTHLSSESSWDHSYGSLTSPMRHHKRAPSFHREVKETLDARVEFINHELDGRTQHRINQYLVLDEIGRGSYGSVHLGKDQYGNEYAIKEFSKVRLRKLAQSNYLRQGPRRPPRPYSSRTGAHTATKGIRDHETNDALFLIRQEIAIMKKLNHPNVVRLIEVLDDPEEDSLYMVMEMCKKGVVMKVGLDDKAEPYDAETCRLWFRDLLLGIEYLHAQGVLHRDIKPDNLLLSEDEVLKVVDFGVSEMFERADPMKTTKSAGSPAFLPPELCGRHGEISGKAADIWSMGVSLFCMKYGRIPFNRDGVLEIYEAIKSEQPRLPKDEDPNFVDLLHKILEKDAEKRIKMTDLREHPWVTKGGEDPLLPEEENCSHIIEPPNELELSRAFTRKMNHMLCVMKAIHRFKALRANQSASARGTPGAESRTASLDAAGDKARAEEIDALIARRRQVLEYRKSESNDDDNDKAQTPDTSEQEPTMFLGIGTGARDEFARDESTPDVVADSPTAVDFNVYDRAYEEAIKERMSANSTKQPTMYLNKFVRAKDQFKGLKNLVEGSNIPAQLRGSPSDGEKHGSSVSGVKLASLISKMKIKGSGKESKEAAK